MIISLLFRQPLIFLVWILAIIFAITIHEFSHALMAVILGDRTPKYDKRLTLNPIAHLDLLGFVFLLFAGFGWGKPVMFNPFNIKYKRFGPAIVSLAGPFSNFIDMFIFGFSFKLLTSFTSLGTENLLIIFLAALVQINLILGIFNLLPLPPLDGSKLLFAILPPSLEGWQISLERSGPIILFGLIILDNLFGLGIFYTLFSVISSFVLKIFG